MRIGVECGQSVKRLSSWKLRPFCFRIKKGFFFGPIVVVRGKRWE